MEDDVPPMPPPQPPADPVSRPSSTSTTESAAFPQLPGIAALAASNAAIGAASNPAGGSAPANSGNPAINATGNPAPDSPQPRCDFDQILQRMKEEHERNVSGVQEQESPPPSRTVQGLHASTTTPMNVRISPAATSGGGGNGMPVCQNCTTSTTPLWRRDEFGSVLCNACGLFLKLHGRPRPISLKTDVIKSRNRVKTVRPDLAAKKKVRLSRKHDGVGSFCLTFPSTNRAYSRSLTTPPFFTALTDTDGAETVAQNAATAAQAIQRSAQKSANGHDGSDSPISRTGTPSMYHHGLPSFIVDDPYQTSFTGSTGQDGTAGEPVSGDRSLDSPQTHEQLIAHNSSLKTRVSELEVINELFRGRLSQLEQQEAAARRGQEVAGAEQSQLRTQLEAVQESEAQLRAQLDDSHRRENSLKRRLDELELELAEAKDTLHYEPERPAKKARLEDEVPDPPGIVEPAPDLQPEVAAESEVTPAPSAPAPEATSATD
ncbi:GATA transcription factor AreB [Drechmeria coniospora]|uniref:GATA transcription factor AreB n=1 Tax=Drechmeria coniospora TaxID=98403 RepID=A0A151GQP5_DRECN|nr:GATA transcription factor AreB [Drechmeria coniospora]KYK59381.1 GATA transcription factor AreB [Drechmeria coniospora]